MNWAVTPASLILLFTASIVTATTALVWRRRTALGGRTLLWLLGVITIWTFTKAMEAASLGFDQKIFWSKLSYLGIAPTAPLLLVFCLIFTGRRRWLSERNMIIFWSIPLLTVILTATNEYHRLIWTGFRTNPIEHLLVYQHGPGFWGYTIYAYLCVITAGFLLVKEYRKRKSPYKGTIGIIFASTLFPLYGNIIYLLGLDPVPGLDTTAVAFAISGIVLTVALLQSNLLDLLPIAHSRLLEYMQDGVIVIDLNNRVLETNPAAAYLLDKLALPIGQDAGKTFEQWPELAKTLIEKPKLPSEVFRPGVLPRYLEVSVTPVLSARGRHDGYLAVLHDITDRKKAEAALEAKSREMEEMSIHDELTHLYNRRYVNQFLEQKFWRSQSYGPPLAIAMIDIDNFKQINDTLGHHAGDDALHAVAGVLRAGLRTNNGERPADIAARMGGDEFLIIMPRADLDDAFAIVERMRAAIRKMFLKMNKLQVSISAGVTSWEPNDTPEEVLHRADELLYRAKQSGRDHVMRSK